MIRDAVLHLLNEQPLLVDLFERPGPADTTLICTNVRTLSGTRPIWIDQQASVFFFPIAIVRFVEIHPGSDEASGLPEVREAERATPPIQPGGAGVEDDLEIDEDFLRRVRDV